MRPVNTNMLDKINTQYASEPVLLIKINWSTGVKWYSDKTYSSYSIKGCLSNVADLVNQKTMASYSEVSSVSIVFVDDDTNEFNKMWKTQILPNIICEIYDWYDGLDLSDAALVFKGKLTGDSTWDEGTRTFSINVESITSDESIILQRVINDQKLPLVFGNVLHIPATKIIDPYFGFLDNTITQFDNSFYIKDCTLPNGSYNIIVEGAKYRIGYSGNLNNGTFTTTAKNTVLYTNVTLGKDLAENVDNTTNIVLGDPSINLQRTFCYMSGNQDAFLAGSNAINYCKNHQYRYQGFINGVYTPQIVSLATFETEWNFTKYNSEQSKTQYYQFTTPGSQVTIAQVAGAPKSSWGYYHRPIKWNFDPAQNSVTETYRLINVSTWKEHPPEMWVLESGSKCFINNGTKETYQASSIPNTIKGVTAYRSLYGHRFLADVPTKYFNIKNVSGVDQVELHRPLNSYMGENWDDDIYFCVASSIGSNTADQIRYLAQTYSSLGIDNSSFNVVKSVIAGYPSNFAIFDDEDLMPFLQDMAWQARCALILSNGVLGLRYLAAVPNSVYNVNYDYAIEESVNFSHSPYSDLITRFIANWVSGYAEDDEHEYIKETNTGIFGKIQGDYTFSIYNQENNVIASATFWSYRLAYLWRTLQFNTPMTGLALETFDGVTIGMPIFSANNILGIVDATNHNVEGNYLNLQLTAASKLGDVDGSNEPIQDLNYFYAPPGDASDPTDVCRLRDYVPEKEYDENSMDSQTKQRLDFSVNWGDKGDDEGQEGQDQGWSIFLQIPSIIYYGKDFKISYICTNDDGTPHTIGSFPMEYRYVQATLGDLVPSNIQLETDIMGRGESPNMKIQNVNVTELPINIQVRMYMAGGIAVSNVATLKVEEMTAKVQIANKVQGVGGKWGITIDEEFQMNVTIYDGASMAAGFNGRLELTPSDPGLTITSQIPQSLVINNASASPRLKYSGVETSELSLVVDVYDDINQKVATTTVLFATGAVSANMVFDIVPTVIRIEQQFQVKLLVYTGNASEITNPVFTMSIPDRSDAHLSTSQITITQTGPMDGTQWSGTANTILTIDNFEELSQLVVDVFVDPGDGSADYSSSYLSKKVIVGYENIAIPITIVCSGIIGGSSVSANDKVSVAILEENTPAVKTEKIFQFAECSGGDAP